MDSIAETLWPAVALTREPFDPQELRGYSIGRAVRAVLAQAHGEGSVATLAPLEHAVSRHLSDLHGRDSRGLLVPVLRAPPMDTSTGLKVDAQTGGLAGFFQGLRDRLFTARRGARVLEGLVGDVQIQSPAGATASWVAEDGDFTPSEITVAGPAMGPRTVGAVLPVTRRLLKQSDPSVDAMVWQEMERAIAAEVDRVAVEGNGTTEPPGVASTATQITTVANNSPTVAEVASAEKALVDAGALGGAPNFSIAWALASDTYANLRAKQDDAGAQYMIRNFRLVDGWPVEPYRLATTKWVLGTWSRLVIGYWGAVDLSAEEEIGARAAKGGRLLTAMLDVGVGAGQPAAFVTHN